MKILRLELRAFGPFTDVALDLSAGSEGLHVIFGPNEAGKSSALRAMEQVFFGIPTRSSDDFVHSYQNLRIGATLAGRNGPPLTFLRRKGTGNTLLQADGITPLEESALRPFLGALDRDVFSTMFGIDHAQLVQGGKEIVRGSGNVGQLLFAAGAGIADLQAIQDRLQQQADELFTRRAHARRINQGLKALDEAKRRARQSVLRSDEWLQHDQALRDARTAREEVERELQRSQREMSRLERLRQALPVIAKRKELLRQRGELGDVAILPADFAEQRRAAVTGLEVARKSQQAASEEIQRLDAQLQSLALPETLLARADAIKELPQALGSYRKAQRDLPGLRAQHEQLENDAAEILRRFRPELSLDMADQLRLTTAQQRAVHDLGNRSEALVQNLAQAREEIDQAQSQLAEERFRLEQLPPPRDPAALKDAVRRTQNQGDLDELLAAARAELRRLRQQAEVHLRRLPLWSGTLVQLEHLAVPSPETVDRYQQEFTAADQRLRGLQEKTEEATTQRAETDRRLEQSRLEGEVPTEEDLLEARRRRDLGWQLVLAAWKSGPPDPQRLAEFLAWFPPADDLAEAYQQAVAAADECGDRLRREVRRVANQANLLATRNALERQIAGFADQIQQARRDREALQQAWQALWQPLAIDAGPPREMRAWLEQQRALLQQAEAIRAQAAAVEQLEERCQTYRRGLHECLLALEQPPAGEQEGLSALLGRCQGLVEQIEAAAAARQQSQKSIRQLDSRLAAAQTRRQRAETELTQWRDRWALAVEPLGLRGDATPAEANEIVTQINELLDRLKQARDKRERIEAIGADAEQFRRQVEDIARQVDPALAARGFEQAAEELDERLRKAVVDRQKQQSLRQQRDRQQKQQKQAEQAIDQHTAQLRAMCQEAGCQEPDALPQAERASELAGRLDETLQGLDDQLLQLGAGAAIEALIAEAQAVNADELPGQLEQLRQQIAAWEARRDELLGTVSREETVLGAMQGNADAADAAEEVQERLAQIETDVQQYVPLRLASAVLRDGIERYRRKNEGPVLRRASELFGQLTLGRFERLSADCDDQGQKVLKGVRAGGTNTVGLAGMSEGTSDQLYLALRLASLESYLEGREPVPFIVDDILISFDNDRAAAALRALAALAQRTQIVFFTHHAHLVDLAREHVDPNQLFVHTLDAAPAA